MQGLSTGREACREVNDRIRELSGTLEVPKTDLIRYLCECGAPECVESIELTGAEYEGVRRNLTFTVVARGHERKLEVRTRSDRFSVVVDGNGPSDGDGVSHAHLEDVLEEVRARSAAICRDLSDRANGNGSERNGGGRSNGV